jgi:hypothetical protein
MQFYEHFTVAKYAYIMSKIKINFFIAVSDAGWSLPAAWLSPLGCTVTLVIGALVSGIVCPRDPRTIDPDLVSPFIRWLHCRIWGWDIGATFKDVSNVIL